MTTDLILGLTGTQKGATPQQKETLVRMLTEWHPQELHLGDCVGADTDAYVIMRNVHDDTVLVGHPPLKGSRRSFLLYDREYTPAPYLERNREIVECSDTMIAVVGVWEEEVRSGTWATVRYARRLEVPIYIIWPDGTVKEEP